jgi:hypothetical protein
MPAKASTSPSPSISDVDTTCNHHDNILHSKPGNSDELAERRNSCCPSKTDELNVEQTSIPSPGDAYGRIGGESVVPSDDGVIPIAVEDDQQGSLQPHRVETAADAYGRNGGESVVPSDDGVIPIAVEDDQQGSLQPHRVETAADWWILVCAFLFNCLNGYSFTSYSVLYVWLTELFDATRATVGWIQSIEYFIGCLLGLF